MNPLIDPDFIPPLHEEFDHITDAVRSAYIASIATKRAWRVYDVVYNGGHFYTCPVLTPTGFGARSVLWIDRHQQLRDADRATRLMLQPLMRALQELYS